MAKEYRSKIGLCPLHCKKIKAAEADMEILQQAVCDTNAYKRLYDHLSKMLLGGYILLGLNHINGRYVAVAKKQMPKSDTFDISLYDVSASFLYSRICVMSVELIDEQTVKIIDWYSYIENEGYGSYFFRTVLAYFRNQGYLYVRGFIGIADYDHQEKLKHIYKKFGFDVSDDNRLLLHL